MNIMFFSTLKQIWKCVLFPVIKPGLFTSRDCRSGEAAAHEVVVIYREWAATKPHVIARVSRSREQSVAGSDVAISYLCASSWDRHASLAMTI